jgi:pyruvate formate lyase activating enzyme
MSASMNHPGRWWHASTTAASSATCARATAGCTTASAAPASCASVEGTQRMVLTTYGRSSGFCIDPIEKKPLNHFYPGSSVLSFGTAGCNLACKFCQNWDISKVARHGPPDGRASPRDRRRRRSARRRSVAFTYNDPVIFAEYAIDVADACRARASQTVAVTAGYIHPERAASSSRRWTPPTST